MSQTTDDLRPIDMEELRKRWWLDDCEPAETEAARLFWQYDRSSLVYKAPIAWPSDNNVGEIALAVGPELFNCLTVLWDADNEDTDVIILTGAIDLVVDDLCALLPYEDEPHEPPARQNALEWAAYFEKAADRLRSAVKEQDAKSA